MRKVCRSSEDYQCYLLGSESKVLRSMNETRVAETTNLSSLNAYLILPGNVSATWRTCSDALDRPGSLQSCDHSLSRTRIDSTGRCGYVRRYSCTICIMQGSELFHPDNSIMCKKVERKGYHKVLRYLTALRTFLGAGYTKWDVWPLQQPRAHGNDDQKFPLISRFQGLLP
jgi:hypothetical protein